MLTTNKIDHLIHQQRQFFATGQTKVLDFRTEQLKRLKQGISNHETEILKALKADLNKPAFEGYFEMTVIREINYTLKRLKSWVKPTKVRAPLDQFPASAQIYSEPLGVVLIIGPWNYPFSLMISPLIGAIAAGNCAVLKPSELAPRTSQVLADLLGKLFDPYYVAVVEGGVETSQQLLAEKFDYIFFTGGTRVGKIVMEAAAKHLTPVTLELGGKSPCIVDATVNIEEAAKRITWGKFINAGQTCIAPDYLFVDHRIKSNLVAQIQSCIQTFYGDNPAESPDYGRIINDRQFDRLKGLLQDSEIIQGGQTHAAERYIAPTVIDNVSVDMPLMQEEIFGPILPILEYRDLTEALTFINNRPKPLALYIFSQDKQKQQTIIDGTSSGGVCINDTILHVGVNELPFGGVGESGIGRYHGKASFDTFSHQKSILQKSLGFDLNWRYAPYKTKLDTLKRLLKS